ncbi:hypothetical protein AnigIFM56816_003295 [Aspergillus niger]|nr:hypothetical protein AnigIFM56816_003295 [Aspergillus niger]
MKTAEFEFDLDYKVMPHDPVELRGKTRDSGKMIVLDRESSKIDHAIFFSIGEYFRPGDLLVLNDSYMLSNTLWFEHGNKESLQLTVYGHEPDGTTIVELKKPEVTFKRGQTLSSLDEEKLKCTLLDQQPDKLWKVQFTPTELLLPTLDQYGARLDENIHLNPTYWKEKPDAYRSVYAKKPGSLEIPSAGLHFSHELLAEISAKGVEIAYITLHVGATEILSVRHISVEEIEKHKVRSEYYEVSERTSAQLNRARSEGRRVIAVGTTVMRTLETITRETGRKGTIKPQHGWTDLYIYPGFEFNAVDVLLTNLHRPRSSHIVLTAAFAGTDFVMRSYKEIQEKGDYEFDMFGDCMLIT